MILGRCQGVLGCLDGIANRYDKIAFAGRLGIVEVVSPDRENLWVISLA